MTKTKKPTPNRPDDRTGNTDNDVAAKSGPHALTQYGSRAEISEMATRLTQMLPGVKKLGNTAALALAQVALRMGLNPFVGEIWAIPNKEGTFSLMTGIKGLRRAAHQQADVDGGFYTVYFRHCTEEELDGMTTHQGDIVRACDLIRSGRRARSYLELTHTLPRFTGIGIYRAGEATRMQPLMVARKRAEADALKQAFDLPLVAMEEQEQPETLAEEATWQVTTPPETEPETHWTHDVSKLTEFVTWMCTEQALTLAQIQAALGSDQPHEWPNDVDECRRLVDKWIAAQIHDHPPSMTAPQAQAELFGEE